MPTWAVSRGSSCVTRRSPEWLGSHDLRSVLSYRAVNVLRSPVRLAAARAAGASQIHNRLSSHANPAREVKSLPMATTGRYRGKGRALTWRLNAPPCGVFRDANGEGESASASQGGPRARAMHMGPAQSVLRGSADGSDPRTAAMHQRQHPDGIELHEHAREPLDGVPEVSNFSDMPEGHR